MEQNSKRGRGRPIAYDPETAVARAMGVFWSSGLEAASLEDLGSAMGMNRPSMRAAFGDKSDLFVQSVALYEKYGRAALEEILDEDTPLRDCLHKAFSSILERLIEGGDAPRGCFLFTVATAETVKFPEVRQQVADGLKAMDRLFAGRLERAANEGELSLSMPADDLAKVATGLVQALSVRARANEPRASLDKLIDIYVSLICS